MAINAPELFEALEVIETTKGISKETVIQALTEAISKGFRKRLGGDDALVKVEMDPETGTIELAQIKKVVEDVQDDFLEISVEDANEEAKGKTKYKVGDDFIIPSNIDSLDKATMMLIKSVFRQKFSEAEKTVLLENFKDKINTMITGRVESVDEKGVAVNIGRTTVFLQKGQMIGDERFGVGDNIRLYVVGVDNSSKSGARILVSRSNEGFLRCLFNEEIREIYDGTIVIKGIARAAGERSKIAVYTNNPDVDPAGACIGQNGSRIQKIVTQLGNGSSKEKIDIISYSDNPGLYVMEALKPAQVIGVAYDEENKSATAVVKDDSLSLAIGRRGVNVRLAVHLTGYNVDIKTESKALEEGFQYQTFEELTALEAAKQQERRLQKAQEEAQKAQEQEQQAQVLPGLPEGYVAPMERVYEEEKSDLDEALESQVEKEDVSSFVSNEVKEEKVEAPKVEEKKEEVKEVKTTTTLSDLEQSLEETKKDNKGGKKNNRKAAQKKEEEEVVPVFSHDPSQNMSIYTEEELKEFEEEEEEFEDNEEDIDYDQYDEYYDDDDR